MTQLSLFDIEVLGRALEVAATTPGFELELEPAQAEALGAFKEDALNETAARESTLNLFEALP